MNNQEKAELIAEGVDEVYLIPTYMEELVKKAIIKVLAEIDRRERITGHE